MGRTKTQLRQLVAQMLGLPFISGTADSGGSTTTLKDSLLQAWKDDEWIGWWVYLSGTPSPSASDLQVTDSAQSTGLLTFIPALSAASDTLSYELLPFSATAIHQALDETLLHLYQTGVMGKRTRIVGVTGSPIYNSDFGYWSGSPSIADGWSVSTGSVTKDTTRWSSEQSVKLTAAQEFSLAAPYTRYLADFYNDTIKLRAWVKSSVASQARIFIKQDTTYTRSSYHSGNGNWELLTVEAKITSLDTTIGFEGGNNDLVNEMWVEGQGCSEYPVPYALMPDGPDKVDFYTLSVLESDKYATTRPRRFAYTVQPYDYVRYTDSADYGLIVFHRTPASMRRMVVEGSGPYTLPSADTDSVEVTQQESLLVAKSAALKLLERRMITLPQSMQPVVADQVSRLTRDINRLAASLPTQTHPTSLGMRW